MIFDRVLHTIDLEKGGITGKKIKKIKKIFESYSSKLKLNKLRKLNIKMVCDFNRVLHTIILKKKIYQVEELNTILLHA